MIELFQITGSASFAARAALEEAGVAYRVVDVHPRRRDHPPDFARVNPMRLVPALRDGAATVYETAAVLLFIAERYGPETLAPAPDDPARGVFYRFMVWLADTLHPEMIALLGQQGRGPARKRMDRHAAYLERELAGCDWCCGSAFSVADVYLYMLVGWQSYVADEVFGDAVAAHYDRVGARPAITRARQLDDLDPRLQRYHPHLRAGQPL